MVRYIENWSLAAHDNSEASALYRMDKNVATTPSVMILGYIGTCSLTTDHGEAI